MLPQAFSRGLWSSATRTLSYYKPDLNTHYAYAHYGVQLKKVGATFFILPMHVVDNDKLRNGNMEALTALRKKARTTKTSVPSPFESIMKEIEGLSSKPLIPEVCTTCGNHDPTEDIWMMLPRTDIFSVTPFHAAHTILERDQERLDFEAKKLQSIVKEQSLIISEKGALSDKISPGILRYLIFGDL
ncbi:hypothetical protein Cgig2_017024 [Carnegiea gigantea]|uniref:P53 and DNA damage-regulated protein 1 n=1 Tax=Carnegiea gigantea TaxID=171969 RepID=A0A9Q1KIQ7_9CARY|nr:hypothetical protein Cgig2_017024 [Carnegiea gigantea]